MSIDYSEQIPFPAEYAAEAAAHAEAADAAYAEYVRTYRAPVETHNVRRTVVLSLITLVLGVILGALAANTSTYGYTEHALNAGVTVGTPSACVGFETKGTVGFFDCADQNTQPYIGTYGEAQSFNAGYVIGNGYVCLGYETRGNVGWFGGVGTDTCG